MNAGRGSQTQAPNRAVLFGYVGALAAMAGLVSAAVADLSAPLQVHWWTLPLLGGLLLAATWFAVPFRYRNSTDAINLVEAALAPLLLAFPPLAVVAVTVIVQITNGGLRRMPAVKTAFNTAMWALAAGVGAGVVAWAGSTPVWPNLVLGLLAALALMGLVNAVAFGVVIAIAEPRGEQRTPVRFVAADRAASIAGWGTNAAFGLLFALAYLASPVTAVLAYVPLIVLHLAYRSYSASRADHVLLTAAHSAAARLSAPLQPLEAVPQFLQQVAECFDAGAVELVLRAVPGGRDIHRVERVTGSYTIRTEGEHTLSLAGAIAASPEFVRLSSAGTDPLSRMLAGAAARTCLAVPLVEGEHMSGALLVFDRAGFDGSPEGEATVLEALGRETSSALAKGRLLADVLDQRRRFAEIVEGTSDGIFTLSDAGVILSWNPALVRITGLAADEVIGRGDVPARLQLRTADQRPVTFRNESASSLPEHLYLTAVDGTTHHLTCSYSAGDGAGGGAALVVVARDVTTVEEHAALQEEVTRLVEVDEVRRTVVEQLQRAVVPAPLTIRGAQVAAAYEASDPTEPTGGDLYDWQVLPSGELHIAVVDVLGHGVAATKDALAVVHTLRVVTAAGTPLGDVVAKADELLRVQNPELVATVLVARFDPRTGRLRVASGGHPPALIVTPRHEVRQVNALGGVIGWPGAGSDHVVETVLDRGDALLLYTDGLVEARKNILDGIEELEHHAAEVADLRADELAQELLRRALAGAERRDDTLALVLRRDFVSTVRERASWTITPDAESASALRRNLGAWLEERTIEQNDCLVVAAELLSNAIRAARTRVALHVRLEGNSVVLDVSDDGSADPALAERGTTLPTAHREGGRGLYLVRAISGHVDVVTTDEMTLIRASIPVAVTRVTPTPTPSPLTRTLD